MVLVKKIFSCRQFLTEENLVVGQLDILQIWPVFRRLTHLLWVLYLFPPWLAAPLLSPDIRWLVLFIEVGWTANQFSTPKGAPEQ